MMEGVSDGMGFNTAMDVGQGIAGTNLRELRGQSSTHLGAHHLLTPIIPIIPRVLYLITA